MSGLAGLDEVGRGSLAGPVCVAAVVLGRGHVDNLKDSKLISPKRRQLLAAEIIIKAEKVGIGWASASFVDVYGIVAGLQRAARRAVAQLGGYSGEIIIDGTVNLLPGQPNVSLLKKADQLIPAVSAASLVAKVARDRYMRHIDGLFPEYGFKDHVGYGTPAHLAALGRLGPCRLHRYSFAPISQPLPPRAGAGNSGQRAEDAAVVYLTGGGWCIIARNWKTRRCEIDIIARRGRDLCFVEVKYRSGLSAGRGLDYVTAAKRRQMLHAAENWISRHPETVSLQPSLAAVEVCGPDFKVSGLFPVEG